MSTKPDGERLATLEANMNSIERKVDDGFDALKKQVRELSESIVTRNGIVDKRLTDAESLENRLKLVETSVSRKWIENTLSAIFGAVLTGLVGAVIYLATHR